MEKSRCRLSLGFHVSHVSWNAEGLGGGGGTVLLLGFSAGELGAATGASKVTRPDLVPPRPSPGLEADPLRWKKHGLLGAIPVKMERLRSR